MDVKNLLIKLGFRTDAKPLEKVQHQLEGMHRSLEFLAAAEVVHSLVGLVERFGGVAESIETAAISAGITIEQFQRLAYSAQQSGIGADQMSMALSRLSRMLYNAQEGGEGANKAFADLGISPQQVAGFRNADDAMMVIADRLRALPEGAKRTALAMEFFGRGSHKLVKYLVQGSDTIRKLEDDATEMGGVLSGPMIEKLAQAEDSMSALFGVIKTVSMGIGARLGPGIIFLVKHITKLYAANAKLIATRLDEWVYDIGYAMGYAYGIIEAVAKAFMGFVEAHPLLVTRLAKVVLGLGALSIVVGTLIGTFGFLASGILNTWGVLSMFKGPMGALLGNGLQTFGYLWKAVGLFRDVLGVTLQIIGNIALAAFPQLGKAVARFGQIMMATPLGLWVAGVAAVVLGAQALYAMLFQGKSFKETWIGQMLETLTGIPTMVEKARAHLSAWLNGTEYKDPTLKTPEEQTAMAQTIDGVPLTLARGAAQPDVPVGLPPGVAQWLREHGQGMPDMMGMAQDGSQLIGNMAAPAMPMLPTPVGSSSTDNKKMTVNNNVSVNVANTMSPEQAQKMGTDAIGKHLDRMNSQAFRMLQTAEEG